jgi:hypothetical protein
MRTLPSGKSVVIWPVRPAAVCGFGLLESGGYGLVIEPDAGVPVGAF